jgi:hypothetical protein
MVVNRGLRRMVVHLTAVEVDMGAAAPTAAVVVGGGEFLNYSFLPTYCLTVHHFYFSFPFPNFALHFQI